MYSIYINYLQCVIYMHIENTFQIMCTISIGILTCLIAIHFKAHSTCGEKSSNNKNDN